MALLCAVSLALAAPAARTLSETDAHTLQPAGAAPSHPRGSLLALWQRYGEAPLADRWAEYAEHYEEHLPAPDGTPIRMLEIGVQSGGGARLWREWYGDALKYVGVDINSLSKRTESPGENMWVEIGSQSDERFMTSVCEEHGPFDVIIDDGGHTASLINASLNILFPNDSCLTPRGLYIVEDLHTMAMCSNKGARVGRVRPAMRERVCMGEQRHLKHDVDW